MASSSEMILNQFSKQNKKSLKTNLDLEALRSTITQQAKYIRHLKRDSADKQTISNEVHRLLDLKFLDPENLEVVEPKVIKIRWVVPLADGSGKTRLQHTFRSRTFVSGAEVAQAIERYTASVTQNKKLALCGTLIKLEQIQDAVRLAVTPEDLFRLSVINPGPTLEDQHIFSFVATWSNSRPSPVYHSLSRVPELIDCGVNLTDPLFDKEQSKIIRQAFSVGVSQMNLLSTTIATARANLDFARAYPRSLFCSVGIHPCSVLSAQPDDLKQLRALLESAENRPHVAAIGEIGLDFSRHAQSKSAEIEAQPAEGNAAAQPSQQPDAQDEASSAQKEETQKEETQKEETPSALITAEHKTQQIQTLIAQLELAAEFKLPVVLHIREAHAEILPILREFRARLSAMMVFCFSGTEQELRDYLDLDCYICITGLICNDARGAHLKSFLHLIPQHRLLIATDAPYLIPYAHLAKPFPKLNTPALLPHIATISDYYHTELPLDAFCDIITRNTRNFFQTPTPFYNGTKPVGLSTVSSSSSSSSSLAQPSSSSSSSSSADAPHRIDLVAQLLQDTKQNHAQLKLESIDIETLPVLKPGQCYFTYETKTFAVSLQAAALLKKQLDLLGPGSTFQSLLTDLLALDSSKK